MPFSFTEEELKLLVLFSLKSAGGVSEIEELAAVVASADANYIDIKTVMAKLIDSGLIKCHEDGDIRMLVSTKDGDFVLEQSGNKIPVTIREKAAKYAAISLAKFKKSILVKSSISEPFPDGFCTVTEELLNDDGRPLIKMDILSPTKMQAEIMAKKFEENPTDIYKKIISILV